MAKDKMLLTLYVFITLLDGVNCVFSTTILGRTIWLLSTVVFELITLMQINNMRRDDENNR